MAKLFNVSEKTLYLYQELGLLEPAQINPETGYRYYRFEQLARLDHIAQLKSMGFSLHQIKAMLGDIDKTKMAELLSNRAQQLRREILEKQAALAAVEEVGNSYATDHMPPICNQIMLENQPARRIVEVPIDVIDTSQTENDGAEWEYWVASARPHLLKKGVPAASIRNIGYITPPEHFDDTPHPICDRVFAQVGDWYNGGYATTIPAGQYLSIVQSGISTAPDGKLEHGVLSRILEYAAHKGLRPVGCAYGEVIYDNLLSEPQGRNVLRKTSIRVEPA